MARTRQVKMRVRSKLLKSAMIRAARHLWGVILTHPPKTRCARLKAGTLRQRWGISAIVMVLATATLNSRTI